MSTETKGGGGGGGEDFKSGKQFENHEFVDLQGCRSISYLTW